MIRTTTLKWCNWSGIAFLLLWLVGFVFFAQVVPRQSPNGGAEQIAGSTGSTPAGSGSA